MSIRYRLNLITICTLLLALVAGGIALWTVGAMGDAVEEALSSNDHQALAMRLHAEFTRGASELPFILATDDAGASRERLRIYQARLRGVLEELSLGAPSKRERQILSGIAQDAQALDLIARRAKFLARKKGRDAWSATRLHAMVTDELHPAMGRKIEELAGLQRQRVEEAQMEARQRLRIATIVMPTSYLLLLLLAGWSVYFVWTRLVKPLSQVEAAAQKIAAGELALTVPVHQDDELGRLARTVENMARSIREYQQELVEKERFAAVGEMTAAVAHNVRNPLASIRAIAQTRGRMHSHDPHMVEAMRTIMQSVDRIDRWLRELLGDLRPVKIQRQEADMNGLLREIEGAVIGFAARRGVSLEMDLDENLPLVDLDRRRMNQAIYSVVINAVEFSPTGGTVRVRSRRSERDPSRVEISVEDDGPGFDAEMKEKLFSPFVSKKRGGTGLGLNLTQRIILGHGGKIAVRSSPAHGCQMTLTLPIRADMERTNGADSDTR